MLDPMSPYIPVALGFVIWMALHRHEVRGDYFLLAATMSTLTTAAVLHWYGVPGAVMLVVKDTVLCLASLAISTIAYRLSPFHPLAKYPGPLLWRISSIGLALSSWGGRRHLYLEHLHEIHGKFVRIGPNVLSVNDASALMAVYGTRYNMAKPDSYQIPGHNPAHALFFQQTREVHAARKQIWQEAFTPASLDTFHEPVDRQVQSLLRCIEERRTAEGIVNLSDCICHWAYDVMGDLTFSSVHGLSMLKDGDPHEIVEGGKVATALLDSFGQTPWLMDIAWHITGMGPFKQLQALAASMVHTRMKNAEKIKMKDIMHYLMKGDVRTGSPLSVPDLETDAIVAIQGGSDNTSTTLIVAIYFMLRNPAIYRRLQADLDRAFPIPDSDMDNKALTAVPLLDAVLHEALRFASPYYLPRVVPPDGAEVGGQHIPGGIIISCATHAQQMSEANFYPNPRLFLPDRWLPGGLGPDTVLNRTSLASFTFGPHVCMGKFLAMQEMRLCLARLVTTFDMQFPSGKDDDGEFYRGYRNMRTTFFDRPLNVRVLRRGGKSV